MKKKITVDGVLVAIMIFLAFAVAVLSFLAAGGILPSLLETTVNTLYVNNGFWAIAAGFGVWACHNLSKKVLEVRKEKDDLNDLYVQTMGDRLQYKGEIQELENQVSQLQKDLDYWKTLAQLKDTPEPEPVKETTIAGIKATVEKVKRRSKKKVE